ncbi:MAG: Crp/Fnr family transcriptional regulator [Pyrinomonadaceae bacterium]
MLHTEFITPTRSHDWEAVTYAPAVPRRHTADRIEGESFQTKNQVLNRLPTSTLRGIAPHLRRVDVQREQFLFQQDDDLEFIYFPETAVISELHLLDDGRMVEVALSGRNDAIGVACLYNALHISNCVIATQAGSLLRMESVLLKKYCQTEPDLPRLLHSTLESYIRQISQRAVCNMYHSIQERLCTWLLLVDELSGRKTLRLTHEQISRALGVYRPSITCIALELRHAGMIDYKRGGISIIDRSALGKAACDCYQELRSDQDRF